MYIKKLPEDLKKMAKAFNSKTDGLMSDIANQFLYATQRKWEARGSGQSYQGEKWEPLSPRTVRARGGRTYPMLIDSADMFNALTVSSDSDTARAFFQTPENIKYARHAKGSDKLPQRIVLDITSEDKTDIDNIVDDFVKDVLKGKK